MVNLGSQYGVDFVAYLHHTSLVHSEYAMLVLTEGATVRWTLRGWSKQECSEDVLSSLRQRVWAWGCVSFMWGTVLCGREDSSKMEVQKIVRKIMPSMAFETM